MHEFRRLKLFVFWVKLPLGKLQVTVLIEFKNDKNLNTTGHFYFQENTVQNKYLVVQIMKVATVY